MVNKLFSFMSKKSSSLKDPRHFLGTTFEPDVDFATYTRMVSSGFATNASVYKDQLLIKYADYPDIVDRIRTLTSRIYMPDNII